MGWTYDEYRRTPADVVIRWTAMLAAEGRARIRREEIERKRTVARATVRRH